MPVFCTQNILSDSSFYNLLCKISSCTNLTELHLSFLSITHQPLRSLKRIRIYPKISCFNECSYGGQEERMEPAICEYLNQARNCPWLKHFTHENKMNNTKTIKIFQLFFTALSALTVAVLLTWFNANAMTNKPFGQFGQRQETLVSCGPDVVIWYNGFNNTKRPLNNSDNGCSHQFGATALWTNSTRRRMPNSC